MLNTSLDILYIVLAVCALFLTIFLCLSLYQFIVAAKKVNRLASAVENIVVKGEQFISFLQGRVNQSASLFFTAVDTIKGIFSFFQERRQEKAEGKKKGKK